MQEGDIELTVAALEACGYRVRVREKNYTRWVAACKGLDVKYVTWHPLTNINQAMQLLMDMRPQAQIYVGRGGVACIGQHTLQADTAQDLIAAQCRAIVNA